MIVISLVENDGQPVKAFLDGKAAAEYGADLGRSGSVQEIPLEMPEGDLEPEFEDDDEPKYICWLLTQEEARSLNSLRDALRGGGASRNLVNGA